jgi:hypothetical protein
MMKDPIAVSARYDPTTGMLVIELKGGAVLSVEPAKCEELAGAGADDLSEIEITPSGKGLYFPRVDADLSVPGLANGIFGSKRWHREVLKDGKVGG